MKAKHIFLFFCLGFMACDKAAKIDLPQADPEMALHCFLSPGKEVQVYLQRVEPLFSNKPPQGSSVVMNAAVYFSNGFDTVQLSLNSSAQFYVDTSASISILPGTSYYLWASAPQLPSVSSACTVPQSYVNSFLTKYDGANNGDDSSFQLSMDWQDLPNEYSYYRVRAENIDSLIGGGFEAQSFNFATSYYSDIGRNGQTIQTGIASYSTIPGSASSRWITAQLITCDVNYFRYHLAVEDAGKDNIFVQAVSIFSNVTGGVGCFGAYMQHTDKIQVF